MLSCVVVVGPCALACKAGVLRGGVPPWLGAEPRPQSCAASCCRAQSLLAPSGLGAPAPQRGGGHHRGFPAWALVGAAPLVTTTEAADVGAGWLGGPAGSDPLALSLHTLFMQ